MSTELHEARAAFAAAQTEAATADAEYGAAYTLLQELRSEGKDPVAQMQQQVRLQQCLARQTIARQMRDGHAAKLKACERRAVADAKRELLKRYQQQADALFGTLAALVAADARMGNAPDSAGLGGMRIAAYGHLKSQDDGAYLSFQNLQALLPQGEATLDNLLAVEPANV
jgi:hypothetical protein